MVILSWNHDLLTTTTPVTTTAPITTDLGTDPTSLRRCVYCGLLYQEPDLKQSIPGQKEAGYAVELVRPQFSEFFLFLCISCICRSASFFHCMPSLVGGAIAAAAVKYKDYQLSKLKVKNQGYNVAIRELCYYEKLKVIKVI